MQETLKHSYHEEAPVRAVLRALAPHKTLLVILAGFSFIVINGAFLYYAFGRPEVVSAAMENPVSVAFMLEAFFMVGFGAWLAARFGLQRPGWVVFVALSIVGSLAFSVPAFLLLHIRKVENTISHPAE